MKYKSDNVLCKLILANVSNEQNIVDVDISL